MRTKEYLAAVRVRDGALALTTMRFHDEVRAHEADPDRRQEADSKQRRQRRRGDRGALDRLGPRANYEDCFRKRLKTRDRAQAQGPQDRGTASPKAEPTPAPDLMAALEETLRNVKNGDSPRAQPKNRRLLGEEGFLEKKSSAKKPAKKTSKKARS